MIGVNTKQHKILVLEQVEIFSDLSEKDLAKLKDISTESEYEKGTVIFREGDKPEFIYFIIDGRIKSYSHSLSGKYIIANITKDIIGLQNIFSQKPLWVSAEAMDDVRVVKISREHFLSFIQRRPLVLIRLLKRAEKMLSILNNRLCDLVGCSADQRVVDILFGLHEKFGSALPFRVAEIASLAGLTRETTIRILGRLKKEGIIKSDHTGITIVDIDTLAILKERSPIM